MLRFTTASGRLCPGSPAGSKPAFSARLMQGNTRCGRAFRELLGGLKIADVLGVFAVCKVQRALPAQTRAPRTPIHADQAPGFAWARGNGGGPQA